MGMTEKLKVFLESKDEDYLNSLKAYFLKRLFIEDFQDAEDNSLEFFEYFSDKLEEKFSMDYIISIFVDVPGGFSDFLYLVDEFIEPVADLIYNLMAGLVVKSLGTQFFEENKHELDKGSDKALVALADNLVAQFNKNPLLECKQRDELTKLLVKLNGDILELLIKAMLSIHLGLNGTAKMQIQHALTLLVKKLTTYNIQHSVVELSAIKNKAKMSGKKGQENRWALKRKVKKEAFRLRDEMIKTGKYKNDSQASKSLTKTLCLFAEGIGDPFTESFAAQMRIYKWFREENTSSSLDLN